MIREQKIKQTTSRIAKALEETNKQAVHQIKLIVLVCGVEQALSWLHEAQKIERQGGMPTSDGTQKRTPGGLYFKLVRTSLLEAKQYQKMQAIFRGKKAFRPAVAGAGNRPRKPRRRESPRRDFPPGRRY